MPIGAELIALDRVSFSYPSADGTVSVLNNINLTIRRGEWVAVAGTNGSGKSTLAKLMAGLIPAASGEISFAIREQPPVQLVFQNPGTQIIGETVFEDVCFGMENYGIPDSEMARRAMDALEQTGLSSMADMPVARLSGGQKQLLAVASCISVNPAVLIFDEATSMLDPLARQHVAQAAKRLHHLGATVVWITQWLDELSLADRVIAMDQGSIIFDGSPPDFFYKRNDQCQTGCDRLQFAPPYTVQVVLSLLDQGCKLREPLPITAAELGKAVSEL
ncbi:energy-coupling factor ABC transporter ATP-binding protein [Paenibacillus piri]|uniref:ATP-binding cassette domain-containing protein n=1 Tax=Paenibacillus piri TaxID=2547395 RepID=A0A4R5KDQ4_9BACL|nr:ATP-binding cassette domain-containing protein [Paenibacillus piri]TDF92327.1 ATP-binding cassette domain-containing protein [Paenibacillus piri]